MLLINLLLKRKLGLSNVQNVKRLLSRHKMSKLTELNALFARKRVHNQIFAGFV